MARLGFPSRSPPKSRGDRTVRPEKRGSYGQCFIAVTASEDAPFSDIGRNWFAVGDLAGTLLPDYFNKVQPKKKAT
jgi:hypothetical protein